MLYNPTIIIRCLSSQNRYFNYQYGQMFYYTDTAQIWYDTQDNGRMLASDVTVLQFERQRNNFVPNLQTDWATEPGFELPQVYMSNYSNVYVVETNSLYRYQNGTWSTIYGTYGTTVVAQTYLPSGTAVIVNADDVTTNGILNDGSVVVRDANRMICGLLRSDGYTLNVLSLIGGEINFDPSGTVTGSGCLQLNANISNPSQPNANLNSNLVVFGDIYNVPPNYWSRQYRLITELINIVSNTTIKAGSTLKAGSQLGDTTYNEDTVLTEDIVNITSGNIRINSKIYKDSIINEQVLQPPFLFDFNTNSLTNYIPKSTVVPSGNVSINGTELRIQLDSFYGFTKSGDTLYIDTSALTNLSSVETIAFNVTGDEAAYMYTIDYISTSGIDNTARIVYYSVNGMVKILP